MPRDIVLIFATISDQKAVYSSRFNLKDIVNSQGKKVLLERVSKCKAK